MAERSSLRSGRSAARTKPPQPLEGPDPVRVPVHPVRLQRVVADRFDSAKLERRGDVTLRSAAVHASEEIGLAAAACARARAARSEEHTSELQSHSFISY